MISEEEIEFYKTIIHELNIVFDVGCGDDNIFDELKPGIEAHLFDPLTNKHLLPKIEGKKNIKYNNFGLGSKRAMMKFHPAYYSILLRNDVKRFTDHSEIEIFVDTVDNYCEGKKINKIDLLKIDTEGFDLEVIMGSVNMLDKIKYIQFEDWTNELTLETLQLLTPYKDKIVFNSNPKNYFITL